MKILMYHRIVNDPEIAKSHRFCTYVKNFKNHLELMNRLDFTTVTFKDYLLYQQDKLTLPNKPVILTFDDGYRDTYELALPVLRDYGMKAVTFALGNRKLRINEWESDTYGATPLMNNDQLLRLKDAGWEVGAHSMNHRDLSKISSQEAWNEIYKSKIILEAVTNDPIISFAYPYGHVNPKIKSLVEKAGYLFGCGVYSGPTYLEEEQFNIRRVEMHNKINSMGLLMRLCAPYEYLDWMRWKAKESLTSSAI